VIIMTRTVAVGVGGAGGWPALAWASEQALQTAAHLVVLHACPPLSPLARQPGTPTPAQVELADPPLARAVAAARAKLGAKRVSLRILDGDPGTALAQAAAAASLLVIGAGGGGSTVRRVIRQARCPVIVARPVPGPGAAPFAGEVVVGVDTSAAGRAAVEFAFEYAEQHRLAVAAVHVTAGTHPIADLARAAEIDAALEVMRTEVDPWAEKYPQVRVRSTVLHGPVGDSVARAAAGAQLLVVGNRRRGTIGRARTGDVPLSVARRAGCPVAVVPVDRREGVPL
jgi:nucleotide-binding universal stress UspA family protein